MALDIYWESLNLWLIENDNNFGTPTARTHEVFKHIGWPVSQILLRKADLDCLPDFFQWEKLDGGNTVDPMQLYNRLVSWMDKTTCSLNDHLYHLVNSETFVDEYKLLLGQIIAQELLNWEGESSSKAQKYFSVNRVRINFIDDDWDGQVLKIIIENNSDDTNLSWTNSELGIELKSYNNLMVGNIPDTCIDAYFAKKKVPYSNGKAFDVDRVYILRRDEEGEWGGWLSQDRIIFSEPQLVLCHQSLLQEVLDWMTHFSEPGWDQEQISENVTCFRNVVIPWAPDILTAPAPDECFVPKIHASVRLRGGIKFDSRLYMKGYEPVAVIEIPPSGGAVNILLDNTVYQKEAMGIYEIDLSQFDLACGDHQISAGNKQIRFATATSIHSVEEVLREVTAGFQVTASGPQYTVRTNGLLPFIDGANVSGPDGSAVISLPVKFHEFVVLGENPGQVINLKPPPNSVIYPDRRFLAFIPFKPQWLIQFGKKNRTYLHLIGVAKIDSGKIKGESMVEWKKWINRRYDNLGKKTITKETLNLWKEYMQLDGKPS